MTLYLNPADAGFLPPVDCPLLIEVDGEILEARRPVFVEQKDGQLTYELSDGSTLQGRFRWTYP